MSYILDALRRAESERDRERGVPGINAQPVPVGSLLGMPSRRSRAGLWIVLGLALGLAVPLGWRWMTAGDAEAPDARLPSSGSVVTQPPMAMAPPPMPQPAAQNPIAPPPVAPPVAPPAPPAQNTAPPPAPRAAAANPARPVSPPVDLPPTPGAAGVPAPPPQAAARPRGAAASSAARAPAPAARPTPTPPATATMAAPLQKLSDLPEDLRRQVPTLAFGGSVYSALPAQRMVIFNGQVLREGDPVANGITVEEIRAKSAVLRLRGQRFEVVF